MRHVLHLMRGQLDLLERNAAPDFVLLGNALYYLRKFPGVVHHPKEELLFELLLSAEPALYHDIERLREQHKMIYELEEWLQEAAVQASKLGAAGYPQLVEFGRRYLLIQKEHSVTEETVIFPQALKALTPADWSLLGMQAQQIENPPPSGSMKGRFQAFYDRVLVEATS
jgi:hemerythrin-like domain-containing protein